MNIESFLAYYEIQRALIEFARTMDNRDWSKIGSILTEDAVGDFGIGRFEGSAAIISHLRSYLDACGTTQHLLGNLLVDVHEETAVGRCYVSDMYLGPGERASLTFKTLGHYHDRWARIGGSWRMVKRIKHNRANIGSMEVFAVLGHRPKPDALLEGFG